MPTASDLVTDLPADFETFGQAVATSMADLLGGTTGQVLSKASNTDMDFTWVTSDDANAIQNAIVDAKGDLIAASAADTPARLAVGNNGETLVADSSTSTGLRYQGSMAAGRNAIIGGSFDIWQRGTSFTSTNGLGIYGPDRWQIYSASTGRTYSRQAASLTGFQYCLRVQRDSGNTNTATMQIIQNLETVNSIPFAGQIVTVSFWARGGANNSDTGLDVNLWSGTGTDQSILSGYTGQALVAGNVATVTTTWQRFSYTATVGSTATQLGLVINNSPTGTAGAADYWEITGIQLEIGSVATNFTRAGGTIQGELAACQRYFQAWGGNVQDFVGSTYSTTTGRLYRSLPVTMRIAPTATFPAAPYTNYINELGTANRTPTTLATSITGTTAVAFDASGMTGATAFRPIDWNTTAQIQYSSEL